MAYEQRLHRDYFFGTLKLPASVADTAFSADAFTSLPSTYSTSAYLPLVLHDPSTGAHEKVWLTNHDAGSVTVTVVRGREGTTAQPWNANTQIIDAATVRDLLPVYTSTTLPNDAHTGLRALLSDTGTVVERTLGGWGASAGIALPSDVGPTRNGVAIPAGAVIMVRAGVVSVTTNSVGDGNVSFKAPFPNGCISVVASSADYTTFGGTVNPWAEGKSGFDARYIDPAGLATPNVTLKISYTAIGW